MFSRILRFVILPAYVVSCALNSRAPEITIQQTRAAADSSSIEKVEQTVKPKTAPYSDFITRYLLGVQLKATDSAKACTEFTSLAQDAAFWARPLAKIRMYETCPEGTLTTIDIEDIKAFAWYKFEFLRVAVQKAIKDKDHENEMRFGFDYSQLLTRKQERTLLLQRSIELAKQLNKKTEEILYLDSLYRTAPRFRPNPQPGDFLSVADDYRNNREFKTANQYYQKIIRNKKLSFEERLKAFDGTAKGYKIQGTKPEYLAALQKEVDFVRKAWRAKPKDSILLKKLEDTHITLARAQWTEQLTVKALATLAKLEKMIKGKGGLDQVFWIRARIEDESGNYEKALDWIAKALLEPGLEPTLKESILWQQAWLLKKTAHLSEARDAFRNLKDIALTPFAKTKYSFWLAKTLVQLNDSGAAENEFDSVIQSDPFSYYSLMAHNELNRKLKLSSFKSSNKITPTPTPSPVNTAANVFDTIFFNWLIDASEVEIARSYIEDYLTQYPQQSTLLLNSLAAVGLFNRIYAELSTMDFDSRNQFIKDNVDFFFPRSYKSDYDSAAKLYSVDINLLLAITRQESGFDPFSRSPADAFGLMQVLPEVAISYSKKLGLNYQTPEDLYIPSLNIPIGANLILSALGRFSGNFIPAVASYNASEFSVKGWIKTRYNGDPVSFIEEIPFEETKSYIKLVMRNYIFYSLLNSAGETDFPKELLTMPSPPVP